MSSKNVLLGVTGGIAAYKSADLVRRLRDRGADVRVVMTEGAQAFVTPLTFQAVSGHSVSTALLDEEAESGMGHIELARWADRVLVAPATADFMARMAGGHADDLLTTLCLATDASVFLAPAMNQQMWANSATQRNAQTLSEQGITLLGPDSGSQACGDIGAGRMMEPIDLAEAILPSVPQLLQNKRVVITAGPTFEDIDPVRFIGNRSSGKMGFAVADAAAQAGADVELIAGPVALETPNGVERVNVRSAQEMHRQVMQRVSAADVFIGVAAVADYTPADVADQKIKKAQGDLTIELVRTPDIIADVAASPDKPFTVGFAAETQDVRDYGRDKLSRKRLDMIAANPVGGDDSGFGSDTNEILLLTLDGELDLGKGNKQQLAQRLVEEIAARL